DFLSAKGLYIKEQISSNITGKQVNASRKVYLTKNYLLLTNSTLPYKLLFNFKSGKVHLIDDKNKRYSSTDINTIMNEEDKIISSVLYSVVDSKIHSRESGNKKMIKGYNCYEVVVYMPRIAAFTSLWLTNDIKTPLDLYFSILNRAEFKPGVKKIISILHNYNSYSVESVTTVLNPKGLPKYQKIKLEDISYKEISVSYFTIPENYLNIPYNKEKRLGSF
ncbi:MAG: hypothetical protein SVR08_18390, partial [Spirochaetota bacterium]|nr:hypothetical protein [Spirochaetota bacterium]